MRLKGSVIITWLFVTILSLSACSYRATDELYALPEQSDAYYDLHDAIEQVMTSGMAYSGPMTGANQQSVQLVNLDSDEEDEAVVFLKAVGELPLKAYVFDRVQDTYESIAVIEGEGSSFDSVEYVQIDGQPGLEILLGRSLSDQIVQSLTAYSYSNGQMVELMTCNYSEFEIVDLDQDGCNDVFVLRLEAEGRIGVAELYSYHDKRMQRSLQAAMSVGAKQIKRIATGDLEEGIPAVFVASAYEEDTIITDIFALRNGVLRNIATNGSIGVSAQTVRNYSVYASDIDNDSVIELPSPIVLPSYIATEETQWAIDWYSMTVTGEQKIKMFTYHNYAGGWYLDLPVNWRGQITVSRSNQVPGATAYTIAKWLGYDEKPQELITVYAFNGNDRIKQANQDGRFLLAEKGETAYAASVGENEWAAKLTQEEITAMFHFIYMDWDTGET